MAEPRLVHMDKVNGYERGQYGTYMPTRATMAKALGRMLVPPDELIPYIPHGNELQALEVYRQIGASVLLAGPTGIGKNMLARFLAQSQRAAYMETICNPDMTEAKLLGSVKPEMVTMQSERGGYEMAHFMVFRPSNISLAAMCGEPTVVLIDELDRLAGRKGIDGLLHGMTNTTRTVDLSEILGPGEVYTLPKGTLVLFALNPTYGDGIEVVGQALRQRLPTIYLEMSADADRTRTVVDANLGWGTASAPVLPPLVAPTMEKLREIETRVIRFQTTVAAVYLEANKRGGPATDSSAAVVRTELAKMFTNIGEAPSHRTIVMAMKAIEKGLDPLTAVTHCMINTVTNDFGSTAKALVKLAKDEFAIGA